jgi:hypothetical protein
MIEMHQTIVPNSRPPEKGSKWIATCTIGGQEYSAISRSGASHELARVLVAAGIPDQEVKVTSDAMSGKTIRRLPGHLRYRSLHHMALWTCQESVTAPLRLRKWAPHPGSTLAVNVLPKTRGETETTTQGSHHHLSAHFSQDTNRAYGTG